MVERKSKLTTVEQNVYSQLVAPYWNKFEDVHETLDVKMKEICIKLNVAVENRDFTWKCSNFRSKIFSMKLSF